MAVPESVVLRHYPRLTAWFGRMRTRRSYQLTRPGTLEAQVEELAAEDCTAVLATG